MCVPTTIQSLIDAVYMCNGGVIILPIPGGDFQKKT